jgi:hypothetical protein
MLQIIFNNGNRNVTTASLKANTALVSISLVYEKKTGNEQRDMGILQKVWQTNAVS